MVLSRISPLLLLLFTLTASACSTVKPSLTAQPPDAAPFRSALPKELSSISVPIEASAEEIGRTLSKVVPARLYQGATKTVGISADLRRNGPIEVAAQDNALFLTLPITASLSYAGFQTPPLPLKLRFRAAASIGSDWRVSVDLRYLGLSELLTEQIGSGPFAIKPRAAIEGLTQPLQQLLSNQVNKQLNDSFSLKAKVAQIWDTAQKPILVDRKLNAWLKLSPREVTLFPLKAQGNRVSLAIGIITYAEVVLGQQPETGAPLPLPPLRLVNSLDRTFRLTVNADLYYKDLSSAAAPFLLNKEFNSDGRMIVVKSFEVYGNGDRFVIKVVTEGSLDGTFYLTGKPRFNARSKVLSVEEVDFDLQSKSLLVQSADWLLHSTIRDRIQDRLNLDLSRQLEESRELAGKAIAQRKLLDQVSLKGEIKTLKIGEFLLGPDRISLQVVAEGESALVLH
ncbi:hypothetical protein GMLC_03080 [Geomonas limicola]|uniref:Lipoprotein n=1 Tax=Geomonas limicola TaxID=2740186 RepID=A0A6V8N604_9BACT|nr:DUF4403 family protein [Geomonas limicola]GFO66729.1 hypothetical protein GMLC_03080 [Geomonas limicola]